MAVTRRAAVLLLLLAVVMAVPTSTSGSQVYRVPDDLAEFEMNFHSWMAKVQAMNGSADPEAIPDVSFATGTANIITVNQNGGANYKTVQAAVNAVPKSNKQRITIQVAAGTYKEKVNIPAGKDYIQLQGAGMDKTKITWNDIAGDSSTYKSASVAVNSDYFIASGISFENSAPSPAPGAVGKQAVALRISGDKAQFDSCGFYGAQDTLYDHKGKHYFKNCFIQGSIDYIFGDGQSIYQGCQLHAIAKATGSLTAQKRQSSSESTGFSFIDCTVTGTGMLYLGRAWGPASRVVFCYTEIADIIRPDGWNDWGVSSRQKTVYYGLYKCSGPGSVNHGFVSWAKQLTDAQAAPFLSLNFIEGKSWVSI